MKKYTLILCTLLLTVGLTSAAQAELIAEGATAPEFTAQNVAGEKVTLSDFKGKAVVLSFWASWCDRCREEMKFLKAVSETLEENVVVVAINAEAETITPESREKVEALIREWELPFPVLFDQGRTIWDAYGVDILPTSIVVDDKGVVQLAEPYFYSDSEENVANVMQLISDMMDMEKPPVIEHWYNKR